MTDELCLYEAGEKNDWFIVIAAHSANAVLSELWEKRKKGKQTSQSGKRRDLDSSSPGWFGRKIHDELKITFWAKFWDFNYFNYWIKNLFLAVESWSTDKLPVCRKAKAVGLIGQEFIQLQENQTDQAGSRWPGLSKNAEQSKISNKLKQNLYVLYRETLNFSPLEKYTQQYRTFPAAHAT